MSAQTRARTTLKNDARTLRLPDLWICPGEEYLTPPEDPDEWTGDMWTCTYIHIDQDHRTADLCLRWYPTLTTGSQATVTSHWPWSAASHRATWTAYAP